jgi:hypothetical protein
MRRRQTSNGLNLMDSIKAAIAGFPVDFVPE